MTSFLDQLTRLTSAESDKALWSAHQDIMRSYGFVHLLYGFTRYYSAKSFGDPLDWVVLSSFPDGYTENLLQKGHIQHDPMIHWVAENFGVCSWRLMAEMAATGQLTERQLEVLEFDWHYGIRAGITISFRTTNKRTRAGIAMAVHCDVSQDDVDALWQTNGSMIVVLNEIMHLKLMSLPQTSHRHLTARQVEVLQWVGDGKTVQDIATLMELRPTTVEKHLRLARHALGVETTAQAVLKASLFNKTDIGDIHNLPKVRIP